MARSALRWGVSAGPAAVLDYLSCYTHRTAIGNERLVAIREDRVIFSGAR